MPRVFVFSENEDIGGVGIAIKRAFDRHGGNWEVRAMRGGNNYIDYPVDLEWDMDVFRDLWEWADVIHAMEKVHNLLGVFNPPGKPLVVHHHGSVYRDNPTGWFDFCSEHGITQLVSTPDMTRFDPATIWLPNPVYLEWMASIRSQYQPSEQRLFTIAHTPTQRWAKHTAEFLRAVDWLKAKTGEPIELVLPDHRSWSEALYQKATAHVLYDQVRDGYGLSGIEAAAMGLPVIAGYMDSATRDAILPLMGGEFPFVEAGLDNLGETLLELATNETFYERSASAGNEFVRAYHDERRVVRALKEIWTKARDTYVPSDEPWA